MCVRESLRVCVFCVCFQHAQDAVKVKEKIVTDQQDSISQLRESLVGREREGEEARLDWEQEQQSLHLQLEQETENSAHLQVHVTFHA